MQSYRIVVNIARVSAELILCPLRALLIAFLNCWLFVKQLEALSRHHAISYFSFPDLEFTKNNIGQKYDVWSWFENNYSPIDIDNMMDDTNHLNEHGNDVLLHEYILKSKVKENLTYLC